MLHPNRRDFLKTGSLAVGLPLLTSPSSVRAAPAGPRPPQPFRHQPEPALQLDLSPAQWIWLQAGRTLSNTVLLFRRELELPYAPRSAHGFILGDSRYRLFVNGQRVQFGPPPADPRWAEADPMDLTAYLRRGANVIGVEVLYYGHGDGTWPIGKPGFIFKLDVQERDGAAPTQLVSDASWSVAIADAWKPGQYKRWYLRAFQEEFDARKYPDGWLEPGFDTRSWFLAHPIPGARPTQPVVSSHSRDYLYDSGGLIPEAQLRRRSIPLLIEANVPVSRLAKQSFLHWRVPPERFFDFDLEESTCFTAARTDAAVARGNNAWQASLAVGDALALTFELAEQVVGFPYFTIEAPAGTVIELLVHEAHDPEGRFTLLNTHFHSWTRFICRDGTNRFECFDFESVKWLQLLVRQTAGTIRLSDVGVRRRQYPFSVTPTFSCGDQRMEKLFAACVNTILNQSQETIVDGMGRERQQYSGDIGHVLHPLLAGFAATPLAARYCNTYSQGLTIAGYFLDCWPAFDRLARIMEREIGLTPWGPLLDHGVGFGFDCYHVYLYTGDLDQLAEVYPRLKRFYSYLLTIQQEDGTLPVENLGVPVVWIDHLAFKQQRHKECAFTLYAATMMMHALAPLAKAMGDASWSEEVWQTGREMAAAAMRKYWSPTDRALICNLPWADEEGVRLMDDRSIAAAILYDLLPAGDVTRAVETLAARPPTLGISYPTNAVWRYWALAKGRKIDVLLSEFRQQWYDMPSVRANNTMGEFFELTPDSNSQWSHASIAPMICLYTSIAGIRPLAPGFEQAEIDLQPGDLPTLKLNYQTPRGEIVVDLVRMAERWTGHVTVPASIRADVRLNGTPLAGQHGLFRVGG
jgi:alpha-L-rhamnosidase